MTSSTSSTKKPRARKLERDRARNKTEGKKTSSRHEAAKKAAADKRKKPTKQTKKRAEREVATVSKSAAPKSDRKKTGTKEVWNPSGKPTGQNKFAKARSTRPVRDDDRRSARVERPRRDDRPRRDERPARSERFERPRREERFEREERPRRDDRPRREERSTRDERPRRDSAPKRTERLSGRERIEPKRPVRAERIERTDRTERIERAPRVEKPKREVAYEKLAPVDLPAWSELGVDENLLPILNRAGIVEPFPIQVKTLPDAISGRDVLGRGQTGSGKTLAFGLAMLTKLAQRKATAHHPLGLVLVPTRELAMQVTDALKPLAQGVDLDIRLIAGGMPYAKQIDALRRSVPILVATPGRLNDLIEQGHVKLDKTEITILDEADQMCDMGFFPQIVEILDYTKPKTQRLLFSATLDRDVDKIVKKYLNNPVEHATDTSKASVKTMDHYLFTVYREDKDEILAEIGSREGKTIFFARTQLGVERIAKDLARKGVAAGALHGGKTQGARTRTLAQFKEGITDVLVATDVAARGIHVDGVDLVVHVDAPTDPKDYLHRAGRTARAGESGAVVTLVGPRQQRGVEQMMQRAGVEAKVVRVTPMAKELIKITGSTRPSGIPWQEPEMPRSARSKPGGRGGSRGGSRSGSRGGSRGSSSGQGKPKGRSRA